MSVQKQKTWIFSIIPIVADFARNVVRYDVFVSYSTENKRQANAIKDLVTKYGAIPFMAPFSIEAGADFQEAIQSNIQNARLFLPLISKKTIKSTYTHQEIGYALRCKTDILPIAIGNIDSKHLGFLSSKQHVEYHTKECDSAIKKRILKS